MTAIVIQVVGLALVLALVALMAIGDRRARQEREEEDRRRDEKGE